MSSSTAAAPEGLPPAGAPVSPTAAAHPPSSDAEARGDTVTAEHEHGETPRPPADGEAPALVELASMTHAEEVHAHVFGNLFGADSDSSTTGSMSQPPAPVGDSDSPPDSDATLSDEDGWMPQLPHVAMVPGHDAPPELGRDPEAGRPHQNSRVRALRAQAAEAEQAAAWAEHEREMTREMARLEDDVDPEQREAMREAQRARRAQQEAEQELAQRERDQREEQALVLGQQRRAQQRRAALGGERAPRSLASRPGRSAAGASQRVAALSGEESEGALTSGAESEGHLVRGSTDGAESEVRGSTDGAESEGTISQSSMPALVPADSRRAARHATLALTLSLTPSLTLSLALSLSPNLTLSPIPTSPFS